MSGLMPSGDEQEYENIIHRAPVCYPSCLMERYNSPEPETPKSNLNALNEDEHLQKRSPEQLGKERLEEIVDTIRADKERAEDNRANRITQAEEDRIAAEKKASNRVLQASDDQGARGSRLRRNYPPRTDIRGLFALRVTYEPFYPFRGLPICV